MFEQMEVAEQVHKGGESYKTPTKAESNRDGHFRKQKGWEAASSTRSEKLRSGKRKTKNAGHRSYAPVRGKETCLLHGPGNT